MGMKAVGGTGVRRMAMPVVDLQDDDDREGLQ